MRFLAAALAICILTLPLAAQEPKKAPDDMKKAIDEFLQKYDANKDGFLTADELPQRLGQAIQKFDKNGDGKLDRSELGPLVGFMRNMGGIPGKFGGGGVDGIVDGFLKQMDTDGDGKISKAEAKGRLQDTFPYLDSNKDGFLDRAELRAFAQRMMDQKKGQEGPSPGSDFDALDKNADGRLSREELNGTRWSARFAEIDADGSGQIDRREFEAFLKKQETK